MINLAPTQLAHARGIVAATKARGLPVRAAHIALATALTESALWMYANGNNSRSLQLPHDRVGWDHGSVGLFQQQVGGAPNSTANWGTTEQLMDPGTSTAKFLNVLGPIERWHSLTNWAACQNVQHSAFSDGSNYRQHDADAIALGNQLWNAAPSPEAPSSSSSTPISASEYIVKAGDTLNVVSKKVGRSVAQLIAANRDRYPSLARNPNLLQIGWKLALTGPAPKLASPPKSTRRIYVVQAGDSLTLIARHYAGVTWQEIAAVNHLNNPNVVHPGERLVIP